MHLTDIYVYQFSKFVSVSSGEEGIFWVFIGPGPEVLTLFMLTSKNAPQTSL